MTIELIIHLNIIGCFRLKDRTWSILFSYAMVLFVTSSEMLLVLNCKWNFVQSLCSHRTHQLSQSQYLYALLFLSISIFKSRCILFLTCCLSKNEWMFWTLMKESHRFKQYFSYLTTGTRIGRGTPTTPQGHEWDSNPRPAWLRNATMYIYPKTIRSFWNVILCEKQWKLRLSEGKWEKNIFFQVWCWQTQ